MSQVQGVQRPETLSPWEHLLLVYAIARAFSYGFLALLTGPFRGPDTSKRLKNHVILVIMREFVAPTKAKIIEYATGSIHDTYRVYAKQQSFEPKWETLPSGTRAYWIGDPKAEKIILLYHGGGYSTGPSPGHFAFCTLLTTTQPSLAILITAYTLAPHSPYPTQLRQATETLHHVLYTLKKSPSSVSIVGDSAGGNLTLAVLSHILHPHPEVERLELPQGEPLKAAILISPWTLFDTTTESVKRNWRKDLVDARSGRLWRDAFLGGRPIDEWNEPATADPQWWEGVEGVVEEVLLTNGKDEILYTGIRQFWERFEKKHQKLMYVEAEGEWHEAPCQLIPADEVGISRNAIVAFCGSRL